jgi:hypothetical protein
MPPIVCYHYPCVDGAFAALCAQARFKGAARFVPLTVYAAEQTRLDFVETLTGDDELYLLDFSGGAAFITAACARAKTVYLIDHHKTALEDVAAMGAAKPANLDTSHLDMARSGATLALAYFNVAATLPPALLDAFALVEANDLWKHVPGSREYAAGLAGLRLEFDVAKNPGIFAQLRALSTPAVTAMGAAALEAEAAIMAEEAAAAFVLECAAPPLRCLAIVTAHPELRSGAGNLLAEASKARGLDAAAVVAYVEKGAAPGTIKVSVRGLDGFDTTPFSRAFGGGGHAGASSCIVAQEVFDAWRAAGAAGGDAPAKRARAEGAE